MLRRTKTGVAAPSWMSSTTIFSTSLRFVEPAEGGSVFVYRSHELRRLLPWLLSWGASARVLSPPEVVGQIRREAQALAESYAEA